MPEHIAQSGYIAPNFLFQARTVLGAIRLAFPPTLLSSLLAQMNKNRAKVHDKKSQPRVQVIQFYENASQQAATRKGLPKSPIGAGRGRLKRVRVPQPHLPLIPAVKNRDYEKEFTEKGLLRFLAILLFSGWYRPPTLRSMFQKKGPAKYDFPKTIMTRGRFTAYFACLRCEESFLLNLEQSFHEHCQRIWVTANVVVVEK